VPIPLKAPATPQTPKEMIRMPIRIFATGPEACLRMESSIGILW